MKWLIILLFPICVMAQDTIKHKKSPIPMIAIITTSVVTGALSDGLNSRMKYGAGHALSAVSWASLIALPFIVKPTWKFPVTYLLIRYSLFDAFYNAGANRKLTYEGGKNYYDESIGKVPLSVLNGTKFVSLGIVIYLNSKR